MSNDKRADYVIRDHILGLLSDVEVASVSNAETAPRLANGDEYVDLEHIEQGVQRAGASATPMGRVLPKKAVHEDTWTKILSHLTAH